MDNSTICAVSTAVGTGAISIVRCSGVDAIKIVNSINKLLSTVDVNFYNSIILSMLASRF